MELRNHRRYSIMIPDWGEHQREMALCFYVLYAPIMCQRILQTHTKEIKVLLLNHAPLVTAVEYLVSVVIAY